MGLVEEIADQSETGVKRVHKTVTDKPVPGRSSAPGRSASQRTSAFRAAAPKRALTVSPLMDHRGRPHCVDTLSCRRYNEVETDREMSGAIRNAREPENAGSFP